MSNGRKCAKDETVKFALEKQRVRKILDDKDRYEIS
jgi:hypothetical protein